ncbi:M14 family metallopeptidase [Pseudomonas graminis]|uniref:M14 family metallopeptidase n=1 Tax=Pseudomonas graminis TaxID=158627 RepID=UPI0023490530|nr:M14 family metallopeptidase [Pseudomonas graminis]MDC6378923.1 M14 family metallopeptidase [Pseudomonas graminis]
MNLSCFSQSYAEARQAFLDSCSNRGLKVENHIHPLPGRDGEQLSMDVAISGTSSASNLLIISSGCHGVEGFCGSGVQIDLLNDDDWMAASHRDDLAVMYVHALNPYGFSHLRRVTNENVDLNRNFLDFSQVLPDNAEYRVLAHLLVPSHWPEGLRNKLELYIRALRFGRKVIQSGITRGQHSHEDGLFFAGKGPTWSNRQIRELLQRHARCRKRVAWVDVHTGLGPRGYGERIFTGRQTQEAIERTRQWWGQHVTNSAEGNSSSVELNGSLDNALLQECPNVEYTGIALEFGTLPAPQVLQALRAEQWLKNHAQAFPEQHSEIKRQLRDAFYIDEDSWKRQVLEQSREVMWQALVGIGS